MPQDIVQAGNPKETAGEGVPSTEKAENGEIKAQLEISASKQKKDENFHMIQWW